MRNPKSQGGKSGSGERQRGAGSGGPHFGAGRGAGGAGARGAMGIQETTDTALALRPVAAGGGAVVIAVVLFQRREPLQSAAALDTQLARASARAGAQAACAGRWTPFDLGCSLVR